MSPTLTVLVVLIAALVISAFLFLRRERRPPVRVKLRPHDKNLVRRKDLKGKGRKRR